MSLLWITGLCLLAVVWVLSIVDLIRHHYSGWTTVGWLVLILILPIIGSLIYWAMRKPTRDESDQQYLAEAELRRERARQPFDGAGMRP